MTKFLSNRPVKSTLTAGQSLVKPALTILAHREIMYEKKNSYQVVGWCLLVILCRASDVFQTCPGKCDQIKDCVLCVGFGTGPLKDYREQHGVCPGKCNDTVVVDELDSK